MTMTIDRPEQSETVPVLGRECWTPGGSSGVLHAMSEHGVPMVQRNAATDAEECPGAVPLPVVGETVRILPAGAEGPVIAGCWMGWQRAREAASVDTVTVRVLVGAEIVSRLVPITALDAAITVTGVTSPETKDAVAAAASLSAQLDRKNTEQRNYLDGLVQDAHEYADENDLCSRFDDFMESHGFPRRARSYEVRITFEDVYVTVMAESQEGADAAVDAEDVAHSVAGALPPWEVA